MKEAAYLPFAFTSDSLVTGEIRRACEPYGDRVWEYRYSRRAKFTVYCFHKQRAAYQKTPTSKCDRLSATFATVTGLFLATVVRHRLALTRPWAPGRADWSGPGPASCSRAAR